MATPTTTLIEVTAFAEIDDLVMVRFIGGEEGLDSFRRTFPTVQRKAFARTWMVQGKTACRRVGKWIDTLRPELRDATKTFAEQTIAGYAYVSSRKDAGTFTSRAFPVEVRDAYLTLPRLDHTGVVERLRAIGTWADDLERWEIPFGHAEALFVICDEFEPELARVGEAMKTAPSTTAFH